MLRRCRRLRVAITIDRSCQCEGDQLFRRGGFARGPGIGIGRFIQVHPYDRQCALKRGPIRRSYGCVHGPAKRRRRGKEFDRVARLSLAHRQHAMRFQGAGYQEARTLRPGQRERLDQLGAGRFHFTLRQRDAAQGDQHLGQAWQRLQAAKEGLGLRRAACRQRAGPHPDRPPGPGY